MIQIVLTQCFTCLSLRDDWATGIRGTFLGCLRSHVRNVPLPLYIEDIILLIKVLIIPIH